MKKSSFLSMVFSALLAATLVVSCDTGGGGGGGGGGSSAPSSTDIKIIIGSDSSSSDILGDFGENESNNFYYEVYFTGGGKTSPKKGGGKGDTISFDSVPFGTYEFNLEIYSDKTEAILIGTETVPKDIQQAENTVEFNLKYSAYQNIYFVSNADSFIKALTGRNKAGNPIDTSNMKADDESTWVRVYVNESFTLEGAGNALKSDTPHYVKVFLNGNTITTNYSGGYGLRLEDKITASFENGNIITPWVQVDAPTASLSLDNVKLTQAGEVSDDGAIFMKFSSGNVSIKNDCKIVATTSQPNLSVSEGCIVTVEDSTIESSEGEAISMNGGEVTLSGTTVKSVQLEGNCVYVSGGSLSVTNESQIIGDGCNAIDFEGGTLTVFDSTIKSNDMFALYLSSGFGGNPVANITNSTVTSGGDAICVPGGTLNLKDTIVTTTGTGDRGISVSGTSDAPAVVTMDGGEVKALDSSYPAVSISDFSGDYDYCKFILTGGGKITGNERGLKMDGGTFVMLGGEIEATGSSPTAAAVGLTSCVFAMTDSYSGTLANGANSVNKINCDNNGMQRICILMGGNSHADVVDVNDQDVIFAQVSDISDGLGEFVGYVQSPVDIQSKAPEQLATRVQKCDTEEDFTLPSGFFYVVDEEQDPYLFSLSESEDYSWFANNTFGAPGDPLEYWSVRGEE